ncbi:hypothetical protein VTI74DRAFT_7984 [Chaetomium olivicolor]
MCRVSILHVVFASSCPLRVVENGQKSSLFPSKKDLFWKPSFLAGVAVNCPRFVSVDIDDFDRQTGNEVNYVCPFPGCEHKKQHRSKFNLLRQFFTRKW